MSSNSYLRFLTEEAVKYLNSSTEERKKRKEASKTNTSYPLNRWFGVLPFSFRLFIKGK